MSVGFNSKFLCALRRCEQKWEMSARFWRHWHEGMGQARGGMAFITLGGGETKASLEGSMRGSPSNWGSGELATRGKGISRGSPSTARLGEAAAMGNGSCSGLVELLGWGLE